MSGVEIAVSTLVLTILEVVLGIDNLVLLAVLTEKLPLTERKQARYWGLMFAWITRLLLLASAVWIAAMNQPVMRLYAWSFSVRNLFMLIGGLFLIVKATQEISQMVRHESDSVAYADSKKSRFWAVVIQIGLLDIVFSLDSVLTAVGLTNQFWVMATAITIAIVVMLYASEAVGRFINRYPTLKLLAFSFLMLVGFVLVADGFSFHIPRGYVYFAMAFSITVETLNIISRAPKGKMNS
ncbi:MAG: TerC family protein [Gammaproteobacteria bacterium]|nr:TerC family protein [Gammaproteobacteria bacterium]